ncbi:hypothetical protein RB195_015812 [Necator americanus]|uniref:EGF-like domain-containing protein n=1 Tax=Necator americanus TaxID=51031 RepID=A0ABR1E8Y6_NECAM
MNSVGDKDKGETLTSSYSLAQLSFHGSPSLEGSVSVCYESFLLLPAVNAQFRRCFANEQFNACAAPCEATCRDPSPEICPGCAATCECKPGFLRNKYGACVDDCDSLQTLRPTCNANEEFRECGTACEPTCWNTEPKNCTDKCVLGCQCKEGYFRNGDDCIAPLQCENESKKGDACHENEELVECSAPCEPTCENSNPDHQDCRHDCVDVCRCRKGFVRGPNGYCFLPVECPSIEQKPPTQNSLDSCDDIECPEGTTCTMAEDDCPYPPCSPPIAVCYPPFPQRSPVQCGPNELLTTCFGCEPTCDHMNPDCEVSCGNPRCVCEEGFARTFFGKCIEKEECIYVMAKDRPPKIPVDSNLLSQRSSVMCGRNEVLERCFGCEPTCDFMNPDCIVTCGDPRCVCKQGFARTFFGKCIEKEKCINLMAGDQPNAPADSNPFSQGSSVMCGRNEVLERCFGCEPTCDFMNPDCEVTCGTPRCMCEKGFARTFFGKCIKKEECIYVTAGYQSNDRKRIDNAHVDSNLFSQSSSPKCGPNELLKKCFGCEPSCFHINPHLVHSASHYHYFAYHLRRNCAWVVICKSITLITLITLTTVDLRTGRAGASNLSICPDRVPEYPSGSSLRVGHEEHFIFFFEGLREEI